jgi:N utilization substance protein B
MISRRNIRVKVMQTLYSIETIEFDIKPGFEIKTLQKHFEHTRQLFIYIILFITEVARYAETSAVKRASKHLPTQEDLNVNIKSAGNQLVWRILEDASYQKSLKDDNLEHLLDKELVRKMYLRLVETAEYQEYISIEGRDKKGEKDILSFIFNELLLPNESFTSHIEELFPNWDDDCDMIILLIQNYLQKPASYNFQEMLSNEKWLYAKNLLLTVLDKKEITLALIKPKLNNWDPDRIATLDMILMQMGVCEFLFFETIPPKVTINEYIDLAKDYSTPQSGQFVNGILDNIHKDFIKENTMNKTDFRKSQ